MFRLSTSRYVRGRNTVGVLRHRRASSGQPGPQRRGLAMVEAAFCLPVMITVAFGGIQLCNMVYSKHALTTAAMVGAQEASRLGASSSSITASVQSLLTQKRIVGGEVTLSPGGEYRAAEEGTEFTLTVRAPMRQHAGLPRIIDDSGTLVARVVFLR